MTSQLVLAPVRAEQIDDVAAIERRCFSDAWSARAFSSLCEQGEPWIFLGAWEGSTLCGYVIASGVCEEGEIANLAVSPARRRQGIGARLLCAVLGALRRQGVQTVFLEVRASNTAARRLYEKYGFTEIGTRRGYYSAPREDAVVMRRVYPPGEQIQFERPERKDYP